MTAMEYLRSWYVQSYLFPSSHWCVVIRSFPPNVLSPKLEKQSSQKSSFHTPDPAIEFTSLHHLCNPSKVMCSKVDFSVQPKIIFLDSYNNSIPTGQIGKTAHDRSGKVIAEVKAGTGSRNGILFGNKYAIVESYAPDNRASVYAFTDLGIDGPFQGYVITFSCDSFAWSIESADSASFDVVK
eukprot:747415-Hanusia_phi.AAC.11